MQRRPRTPKSVLAPLIQQVRPLENTLAQFLHHTHVAANRGDWWRRVGHRRFVPAVIGADEGHGANRALHTATRHQNSQSSYRYIVGSKHPVQGQLLGKEPIVLWTKIAVKDRREKVFELV